MSDTEVAVPVDRAARDRLADVLAAYMRGEVDNFALDDACGASCPGRDPGCRRTAAALWYFYDDLKPHRCYGSAEQWEMLRRMLAFLRSDLDTWHVRVGWRLFHARQLLGLLSLTAVVGAIALFWREWELLALFAWLVGAVIQFSAFRLSARRGQPACQREEASWFPFPTEEDWLRHEPLLEAERLPAYDAGLQGRAIRPRSESIFLRVLSWFALGIYYPLASLIWLLPESDTKWELERTQG